MFIKVFSKKNVNNLSKFIDIVTISLLPMAICLSACPVVMALATGQERSASNPDSCMYVCSGSDSTLNVDLSLFILCVKNMIVEFIIN